MKFFKTILILSLFSTVVLPLKSQVRITMQKEGGVYTTPCIVNGLRLRFIFDTGASNVSISLSEALFMLKNGYLDQEDLHGSSYSQLANGEIVENTTITLREFEIGGIKLENIDALVIHELSAPLLLGQSVIERLGKIQIEGNELTILKNASNPNIEYKLEAYELVEKGRTYYFDKLFYLAANTLQTAYNIDSELFDCFDIGLLGSSYYYNGDFELAIKYIEKHTECTVDIRDLYFNHSNLAYSYRQLKKFNQGIINAQKALTYTNDLESYSGQYFEIGLNYYNQGRNYEAITNFEKAIDYYLSYISRSYDDIDKGKVTDTGLGNRFYIISNAYHKIGRELRSLEYMRMAALCGDEGAVVFCYRNGINYKKKE